MHGILSSKRHHTFARRPADAASREADFSETMDSERQISPSIRLVYLYLLGLAQGSPMLDPRARPVTAAERKWVQVSNKRTRSEDSSKDAIDSGGNDQDGDGSNDHGVGHDSADSEDFHTDDAKASDSEATTGINGPSAQTRSHDRSSQSQLAMLSCTSTKDKAEVISTITKHHQHREWLEMLPIVEPPLLDLKAIQIGKHCVVRLSVLQCLLNHSTVLHMRAKLGFVFLLIHMCALWPCWLCLQLCAPSVHA